MVFSVLGNDYYFPAMNQLCLLFLIKPTTILPNLSETLSTTPGIHLKLETLSQIRDVTNNRSVISLSTL